MIGPEATQPISSAQRLYTGSNYLWVETSVSVCILFVTDNSNSSDNFNGPDVRSLIAPKWIPSFEGSENLSNGN